MSTLDQPHTNGHTISHTSTLAREHSHNARETNSRQLAHCSQLPSNSLTLTQTTQLDGLMTILRDSKVVMIIFPPSPQSTLAAYKQKKTDVIIILDS